MFSKLTDLSCMPLKPTSFYDDSFQDVITVSKQLTNIGSISFDFDQSSKSTFTGYMSELEYLYNMMVMLYNQGFDVTLQFVTCSDKTDYYIVYGNVKISFVDFDQLSDSANVMYTEIFVGGLLATKLQARYCDMFINLCANC